MSKFLKRLSIKNKTVPDPYAALRNQNFRFYAIGMFSSEMGQQMVSVAIGWEIYAKTHSALALGWVGLCLGLPNLFLVFPAGVVADRYSRKRLLMLTQFLGALCFCGLAFISHGNYPVRWIYGLLLATGVVNAFNNPARWSLVPQLVPMKIFNNAVTWGSTCFQTASVAGPALGGFLIKFLGFDGVYFLGALGMALFFLSLIGVEHRFKGGSKEKITLESLLAGLRYVFKTKIILATITLDLFAVLFGGAKALLPMFAKDILHCGETGLGLLLAAPSAGAVLMAIFISHRPPMKKAGKNLLWAVAGFGAATIVFGLSKSYWLSMGMLFLTGAFDNISVVIRGTLVQVLTPDSMRGRVSAVNFLFIGASNEFGAFESGVTANWFGAVASVVGGGIGTLLVVLAVCGLWPELLKLGELKAGKKTSA